MVLRAQKKRSRASGQEVREVLDKFVEDFPKDVWLKTLSPEMTPKVVAAFAAMTWVFLVFDDKPVFLTCDDPVCFFRGIGIGKPESEVAFPISSNITLWLTWRQNLSEGYFVAPRYVVKEVNSRVSKNAKRYLFHALDEEWVLPFARKGKWDLHLMNLRQK